MLNKFLFEVFYCHCRFGENSYCNGGGRKKFLFGERIKKKYEKTNEKLFSRHLKIYIASRLFICLVYILRELFLLKICYTIVWVSKSLLRSDDNISAVPGSPTSSCQDCKWCYFSTKQWCREEIRSMNCNKQNMNLKLTW